MRGPAALCTLGARALSLVLLGALLAVAAPVRADPPTIYKWVDENGISHYTTDRDRIPPEIRDRIVHPPAAAAPAAASPSEEDATRDALPVPQTAAVPAPSAPAAAPPATLPEQAAPSAPAAGGPAAPQPAAAPPAETRSLETAATEPATPSRAAAPPSAPHAEREPAAPAAAKPSGAGATEAEPGATNAPLASLDPEHAAAARKLDTEIQSLEGRIAQQEDQLAALISTPDEQRTTPLVDDPQFREISQSLPKLQADLQALRAKRAEIQPTVATP